MRTTIPGRLAAASFIAVVAFAPLVAAQPSGAQAEALFRQGRELLEAGKTAEACNAFAESQKLDPSASTLLNLAGCREKNGQLATAWGLFLEAEHETRSATDAAGQQLHTIALDRANKLEARVSKLTVNVPQTSQIDGLQITRGTDTVDSAMWNRALPVDGGTYTITAHAPGSNTWKTDVTINSEGDSKTVDIPDLRGLGPVVGAGDHGEGPGPEHPHSRKALLVPPIATSVVTLGLLGASLAFELSAESQYNSAKAELSDQARRDSLYDSANTRRHIAAGLLGGGVVAAGVTAWLFVRAFHHHERAETVARHIAISPGGFAVIGQF